MEWTCLGHAMWLADVGGTRVLFDPLLDTTHHDGVFRVHPPRAIDLAGLAPDLVVVTHAHPDHFDLPSLARLAGLEPRPLLVTPDPLVAWAAERLGFDVCALQVWEPLPLDGGTLLPTPSFCDVVEWGMLVATPDGVVWNQVDTELQDPAHVRAVLARAAELLERPGLADGPDVGIVRWQPLRQVSATLAGGLGFPTDAYRRQLAVVAATNARAYVPGAAGARYADGHEWLNTHVFPVGEERFLRDLAALRPGVPAWAAHPGTRMLIADGCVTKVSDSPLVSSTDTPDPRTFLPWHIPDLVDPTPSPSHRPVIEGWLRDTLTPALLAAAPRVDVGHPLRLALRVVYGDTQEDRTFVVGPESVFVGSGLDPDHDAAVAIVASTFADVITGRSHWGKALLGGHLRAVTRAYRVDSDGLHPAKIAPIFLYYGLSYELAFARWVAQWLDTHDP